MSFHWQIIFLAVDNESKWKTAMTKAGKITLHPFLMAMYPILFLLAQVGYSLYLRPVRFRPFRYLMNDLQYV